MSAGCPKQMTYGPCGGVQPDGSCEIGGRDCPFVAATLPVWSSVAERAGDLNRRAAALAHRLDRGGVIVADFPARALDAESLRACAATLAGVDAVLLGDAPSHRVQFPPAYRAGLVLAAGAEPWVGLNTRDRNRVALEAELAALADVGAGAVHCVTGDHPASGHRPDAAPVFDLDSTQLTALAAGRGLLVSVAESPAASPTDRRAARLLSKELAGAEACFINHCGGVDAVRGFVSQARALDSTAAMIALVPVVCDSASAALLASFREPGLDEAVLAPVLNAVDPRAAGIALATQRSAALLEDGAVAGVNLSGGPGAGEELAFAEALAEVADRVRA